MLLSRLRRNKFRRSFRVLSHRGQQIVCGHQYALAGTWRSPIQIDLRSSSLICKTYVDIVPALSEPHIAFNRGMPVWVIHHECIVELELGIIDGVEGKAIIA